MESQQIVLISFRLRSKTILEDSLKRLSRRQSLKTTLEDYLEDSLEEAVS